MRNFILFLLGLCICQNINSQVLLQENFQTSGAVPTALPAGWFTNLVLQNQTFNEGPAFSVHNSASANNGGYWPVPELSIGNRFAGVNDDGEPCDCDNIDAWLQTPGFELTQYSYEEVWAIINYTPVFEPWTDSQPLGDGPEHIATIVGDPNVSWNSVTVNFTAPDTSLPVNVNINGMDYTLDMSGTIDISMSAFSGDLDIYIASNNGGQLTGVEVSAAGDFLTGDYITDTIPANPGDFGAEVVDLIATQVADNYTLSFNYYHDANYGGGDATVQVSVDGGITWNILDILSIDQNAWQTKIVSLSAYLGQYIMIRFQWSDNGAWASGFAVDNVVVREGLMNDLIAIKTKASDWNSSTFGFGYWEYSQVPLTQASPIRATAVLLNAGINDQSDVSASFTVEQNGNIQQVFETNPTYIGSLQYDTLSATSSWIPSELGVVSIHANAQSSAIDEDDTNNSTSTQIEITNDIYARDLGAAQAFVGPGTAYEYGNLFDIYANDQIGAIDVAVNFFPADEGSLIQGRLYEFTGLDAATGEPMLTDLGVSTIEYAVTAADNNAAGDANFIHLTFNEPISLEAGKIYMAAMISDGSVRMPVSGDNDWVVSWLNDGTWGATTGIPMIRLNFDETLAQTYGCTDPMACNFNGSATADDNSCYYPSQEVCDGWDNDCNGMVDDGLNYQYWYADYDGDGLGNYWDYYWSCTAYAGYVGEVGDCDDFNPDITGSSPEVCDAMDNDCDGEIDDEVSTYYYYDQDNDGYGWGWSIYTCNPPAQYVANNSDCNDNDPQWHQYIEFFIDMDGDGFGSDESQTYCSTPPSYMVDNSEDCFPNTLTYLDGDNDGFGGSVYSACGVMSNADCDDANPQVNTMVSEICDQMDNDCDGVADDGLDVNIWFLDGDGDGYGGVSEALVSCQAELLGYELNASDCMDGNAMINPTAIEICDGLDNNCSGVSDEGLAISVFFIDTDADGYGSLSSVQMSCQSTLPGYVDNADDCDDNSVSTSPASPEICDGLDNNCNGDSDEGLAVSMFFIDTDADGYGSLSSVQMSCLTSILGYSTNATDCDDLEAAVNPLATEIDDNDIDENCDGLLGVSTSVQDYQDQNGVQIYPNPAQSFIRINGLSESSTVRIFDATGKEVKFVKNYAVSQMIELHDLSSGFYIVQIQTGVEIKRATIELLR